jgi:hypothetical protein
VCQASGGAIKNLAKASKKPSRILINLLLLCEIIGKRFLSEEKIHPRDLSVPPSCGVHGEAAGCKNNSPKSESADGTAVRINAKVTKNQNYSFPRDQNAEFNIPEAQ